MSILGLESNLVKTIQKNDFSNSSNIKILILNLNPINKIESKSLETFGSSILKLKFSMANLSIENIYNNIKDSLKNNFWIKMPKTK